MFPLFLFREFHSGQSPMLASDFEIVHFVDETASWRDFTAARVQAMADDEALQAVLGQDVYPGLKKFYSTVRDLFAGGHLGGLSVFAMKPLGW
jgi:hypothetical protein